MAMLREPRVEEAESRSLPAVPDVLELLDRVPVAAESPGMIDQLRLLEDLKCAAAALQARIAVTFDAAERRAQAAAGLPSGARATAPSLLQSALQPTGGTRGRWPSGPAIPHRNGT